jgi:methionine-gamma-lyase
MKSQERSHTLRKSTRAIHAGGPRSSVHGELSVPIYQSSTFSFPSAEEGAARFAGSSPGYIYGRLGNPTVDALEDGIASLEGGFGGIATSSGMAAVTSVFMAFLGQKTHVVATNAIYGSSRVALDAELSRFGVESTFVDTSEITRVKQAMRADTKMIFIETPTNPTMIITDLQQVAEIARRPGVILVVDNTFASPYLQRPLELGADLVVHSLTKFINGHSDVIGGMIVARTEELHKRLKKVVSIFGATMDPHQAWLILRGVRTLALRVEKAQQSAMQLSAFLGKHPKVTWVRYPGLPDHPQHEIARKQMDGFGSMLCFGVKGGLRGGITLMNGVRLINLAVSLGGIESLIEHPASMTHASIPREEREGAGILDELVRLSVGCEDFEDLREDLDQALNRIP